MLSRSLIKHSDIVEGPTVEAINLQVRTAMSVPFATHMLDKKEAPTVEAVNLQVRTAMSVPYASYMSDNKPKS